MNKITTFRVRGVEAAIYIYISAPPGQADLQIKLCAARSTHFGAPMPPFPLGFRGRRTRSTETRLETTQQESTTTIRREVQGGEGARTPGRRRGGRQRRRAPSRRRTRTPSRQQRRRGDRAGWERRCGPGMPRRDGTWPVERSRNLGWRRPGACPRGAPRCTYNAVASLFQRTHLTWQRVK